MCKFDISSVNVNGLNDKSKRNTILNNLKNSNANVVFLQDLKAASKKSTSEWFRKWEGESFSTVKSGTSSIAILFSKDTAFQVTNALEDPEGRFLLLNGTTEDQNVAFCNVYALSGYPKYKERSNFFNNLKTVISEFKPNNSQLTFGGDFNCVLDDELDRSRPMSKYDPSVKSLNPILPGLLNTLQTRGGGVFYPLLIRLFFILEA